MRVSSVIISILFLSAWTGRIFAYEPGTHQLLSQQAAQHSILGEKDGVLSDLDLKELTDKVQEFPDPQDGQWIYLGPNNTDRYNAPASANILDLIKAGAALEDEFSRSLFHFYDPVAGRLHPLNVKGIPVPYSAPDWALADMSSPFGQSYSLKNANSHFYRALTSANEDDRNQAFGNLFLTIGHVIHLVQDMAQPQHVRNDMHCDANICADIESALIAAFGKFVPLYNPSLYESYTYEHANVIGYGGYTPVSMPLTRDYWASPDNKGLAQFTNMNFVSAGTNFQMTSTGDMLADRNYLFPVPRSISDSQPIADVYMELGTKVPKNIAEYCAAIQNDCGVQFAATDVVDRYLGTTETNSRAASYSIFNQDLVQYGSQKLFTLNALNFRHNWMYLLPRAIAYSAGLIDYFFRGRLDVQQDPNTPGGYLVFNKSSYPMTNGTLTLYYDDADGNRYPVPDASWSDVSMGPAGDNDADGYPIQFSAPTDPAPGTSGEYMLVFQGKIGAEDGIAGKVIKGSDQYVYLAARMDSSCNWRYNCASVVESFDAAYKIHSSSVHIGTQVLQESLAVYDGVDYTIENPAWYDPNYTCNYLALRKGVQFAASDCKGESIPSYLNAIAANTQHVYIFTTQRGNNSTGIANVYDHAGNFLSSITNLPIWYVYKASVTDSHMCLNGSVGGTSDSVSLLADLNGNKLLDFPTDPIYGAYCALTQDRMYLLNLYDGNAVLNVFDLNGSLIASLDAWEPTPPNIYLTYWDIAASDQKIYIPIIYELMDPNRPITFIYKFIVFSRLKTRNSDGTISEKFQREPDVTLPGLQTFFGASVAVDMKDVLGNPGKQ